MAWYIMSRDTPPPLRKMGGSRVGKVVKVGEYCGNITTGNKLQMVRLDKINYRAVCVINYSMAMLYRVLTALRID